MTMPPMMKYLFTLLLFLEKVGAGVKTGGTNAALFQIRQADAARNDHGGIHLLFG